MQQYSAHVDNSKVKRTSPTVSNTGIRDCLIGLLLALVALAIRFYRIEHPDEVV